MRKYKPTSDGRLRVSWESVFHEGDAEVFGPSHLPSQEVVTPKRVLRLFQLDYGVFSHDAARALDLAKYIIAPKKKSNFKRIRANFATSQGRTSPPNCTSYWDLRIWIIPLRPNLQGGVVAIHRIADRVGPRKISAVELEPKPVDFSEVSSSKSEITHRVLAAGLTSAEGFDCSDLTYGRAWHLEPRTDQVDLAWII